MSLITTKILIEFSSSLISFIRYILILSLFTELVSVRPCRIVLSLVLILITFSFESIISTTKKKIRRKIMSFSFLFIFRSTMVDTVLTSNLNEEELNNECQRWALAHGKCGFSMFVSHLTCDVYFFNIDFQVLFNVVLLITIILMLFPIHSQSIHQYIPLKNIIVLINFNRQSMH